jgi:glutaredoxin
MKKLEVNATKEELLEAVPNAKSVPQIFLNGEFVGGVKELRERLKHVD